MKKMITLLAIVLITVSAGHAQTGQQRRDTTSHSNMRRDTMRNHKMMKKPMQKSRSGRMDSTGTRDSM